MAAAEAARAGRARDTAPVRRMVTKKGTFSLLLATWIL